MKNRILISEDEKKRILSMHVNAGLKSIVSEQSINYANLLPKSMASELYNAMSGLDPEFNSENFGTDKEKTIKGIIDAISTEEVWNQVKSEFTKKAQAENEGDTDLDFWLKEDLEGSEYDTLMNALNKRLEDNKLKSMYKVGTKIKRITNRGFIANRAIRFADTLDGNENDVDLDNCTVVKSDKDSFTVKVPSLFYYPEQTWRKGLTQIVKSDVCVKIPFRYRPQIYEDTLQIEIFSNWITDMIVPC
jgi:hypothetical protein